MTNTMIPARKLVGWCGVVLLVVSSGCARAYHAYPCGCVPYDYCPPPPLAYAPYDACPTPVARCYASEIVAAGQTALPVRESWE
jgi:hypothetical protein